MMGLGREPPNAEESAFVSWEFVRESRAWGHLASGKEPTRLA